MSKPYVFHYVSYVDTVVASYKATYIAAFHTTSTLIK